MHRHIDDTVKSIERYSKQDGRAWRELMEKFLRAKDGIAAWMNSPPASLASSIDRLACMPHGLDEYRFELQSLRSWCNETFEAEQTKLFLGAFACHASVAPDDVGGAHLAWLFTSIIQDMGNRAVKGGMHHLPLALASHLQSKGGEIWTDARVSRITVKGGKAVGVQLAGGEEITVSKVVASNADPRHLIVDLLGEQHVGADIVRKIERYEWGDGYMVIYLALDGPLRYRAGEDAGRSAYVHPTPPTLEYLARIYAECRSGELPAAPLVVMCNDSAMDSSRCPAGKAVMKLIVHNVPYEIKGDATGKIAGRTWDAVKEPYADHVLDMVTNGFVPNLKEGILKRVVHSPVDMERSMPSAVRGTVPWRVSPLPGGSAAPHSGAGTISNAGCECLPLRLGQPSRWRRVHGARPQCGSRDTGGLGRVLATLCASATRLARRQAKVARMPTDPRRGTPREFCKTQLSTRPAR